nr:DUF1289 domain-containing protein [Tropicimonas sp. IMCC34043]
MPVFPSPCIDQCSFRRRGHCVGCSMTQAQKRLFQGLKKRDQRAAFIDMIIEQQLRLGRYDHWPGAYKEKRSNPE